MLTGNVKSWALYGKWQLAEFETVESPLPMGIKIPKMPSSTADIAGLFGGAGADADSKEEAEERT